jgi:hypothetical protein
MQRAMKIQWLPEADIHWILGVVLLQEVEQQQTIPANQVERKQMLVFLSVHTQQCVWVLHEKAATPVWDLRRTFSYSIFFLI